ncbi:MAG: STN domain-containing protein, partial [Pseudoalteromonas spongiae]
MPSRVLLSSCAIFVSSLLSVAPIYAAQSSASSANFTLVQFDLPAGNLGDSLTLLSRQAGITLSFDEQIVKNISALELKGRYSTETALNKLLQSTSLEAFLIAQ